MGAEPPERLESEDAIDDLAPTAGCGRLMYEMENKVTPRIDAAVSLLGRGSNLATAFVLSEGKNRGGIESEGRT